MEIILFILQILGMIILVLLGILILVVLVILFVPVRYQFYGKSEDDIYVKGKASWLLHFIRAHITYENELLDVEVKILWKKIDFKNEEIDTNETSEEKTTRKSKISFHRIKEKVIFIKNNLSQIKKIVQNENNKKAFHHLKKELFYLVKILLPRKSKLNGIFSTGSPDTTGQLFGVICCFPIIYQDNWILTPDFKAEKAYFKGQFQGKGKIYIFQLFGILIRIIMDKNCRRLYYFINRLGGQNNGRGK